MASPPPNKAPGLPNPYAKGVLPNPYALGTISAPPVKYTEEEIRAEQQKKAPAFHNPHSIKRPQPKKPGPVVKRPTIPKAAMASPASSGPSDPSAAPESAAANPQQHGIDYYRSTADDDAAIMEERRARNYEEKQRKKEHKKFTKLFGSWNPQAPYKAQRYSNLRAYRASGGYQRKKEGFKAFLQAAADQHRALHPDEPLEPSRSASRAASHAARSASAAAVAKKFFAPPASYDHNPASSSSDQTGEDAYARRMLLSQSQANSAPSLSTQEPVQEPVQEPAQKPIPPPPSVANDHTTPPPPPPPPPAFVPTSSSYQGATISAPPERYAHATISAPPERYAHATISAPPERYAHATISAAPVRYDRPDMSTRDADDEPNLDERPSKRPKISKAEAMMAKMGYKKGQGLGKNNDGVVTHLEVKMRKGQQGASILDGEDNKIKSQQVWDVRGGTRKKDEPGKFGEESSVVVTWGCVDGVDWDANADRNDGGIRQDMGEAFSTKFGPVEQILLDEGNKDGTVYIRFQSILSALNAVNRFDEGWEFRGRKIRAQYYDERKFQAGIYDY